MFFVTQATELSLHPPLCYFTSRKKSTLSTRLTTTMTAINSSTPRLAERPVLLMIKSAASIPIPVSMLNTRRGIAKK